jgi:hypothetical protein
VTAQPEIKSSFEIEGVFDPEAFSRTTGLSPTDVRRAGEFRRDGQPWETSRWRLVIGPERNFDHAAQVARLLDAIEPAAREIEQFAAQARAELWVKLWWPGVEEEVSNPVLSFPPRLLARLARLGATLDIDV